MTTARPTARPTARWEGIPPAPAEATERLESGMREVFARAGRRGLPPAIWRLLTARGVTTPDEAMRFLSPKAEHLGDPETLVDLPRAADRLAEAVRRGETILVHGDYDVDGICSTTLMTRTLRALGGTVVPFIPDRLADGYDLGPAGVAAALAARARVVLTCDCGTTALAPARELAAAGVDLIISDHHLPGPELPTAFAIVNPRRADCDSADKDLAAVGVAYKLALALVRRLRGDPGSVDEMLDLVALATVADVAPLRGENRVLVRLGLERMQRTGNLGLRALIRSAGLDGKPLTAGRLGFTLAPRLNALGRMDRALRGVELLLAGDQATANAIARECEELNQRRQAEDQRLLAEAMRQAEARISAGAMGLVLSGEGWHPGVIGIVASRVVERTMRPTFIIGHEAGVGKGSGRSVGAFDLHQALHSCGHLLVKYGGHRAAAGLTIEAARIAEFAARFDEVAQGQLSAEHLLPVLRTDLEVGLAEADDALERALRHLEPFGVANPAPVLVTHGVRVAGAVRSIGKEGKGVRFSVTDGSTTLECVSWSLAERRAELARDAVVDIAFKLDRDTYGGRDQLQATVQDVRRTEGPRG